MDEAVAGENNISFPIQHFAIISSLCSKSLKRESANSQSLVLFFSLSLTLEFLRPPLARPISNMTAFHENPSNPSHVLSQFSLKGKVAAVTGGAGGIGIEIVRGLAEAGANVALIYRTNQDASKIAAKIASENGVTIKAYQADVTNRSQIASTIETIAAELGHLDIVVVNAGVCSNVKSLEYTEELWQHINNVNIDGAMWTAQAAGKIFKTQGKGNLIITASVSSIICNYPQAQAAYNASKAAVAHLGKCLAMEWATFARVNMVSPGYIATDSMYTLALVSVDRRLAPTAGTNLWCSGSQATVHFDGVVAVPGSAGKDCQT